VAEPSRLGWTPCIPGGVPVHGEAQQAHSVDRKHLRRMVSMELRSLDEAQRMLCYSVDNVLRVSRLFESVKLGAARNAGWQRDGDPVCLSEAVGIQRLS
jgi:hypothetical protein